jgi:hypothetical protein
MRYGIESIYQAMTWVTFKASQVTTIISVWSTYFWLNLL